MINFNRIPNGLKDKSFEEFKEFVTSEIKEISDNTIGSVSVDLKTSTPDVTNKLKDWAEFQKSRIIYRRIVGAYIDELGDQFKNDNNNRIKVLLSTMENPLDYKKIMGRDFPSLENMGSKKDLIKTIEIESKDLYLRLSQMKSEEASIIGRYMSNSHWWGQSHITFSDYAMKRLQNKYVSSVKLGDWGNAISRAKSLNLKKLLEYEPNDSAAFVSKFGIGIRNWLRYKTDSNVKEYASTLFTFEENHYKSQTEDENSRIQSLIKEFRDDSEKLGYRLAMSGLGNLIPYALGIENGSIPSFMQQFVDRLRERMVYIIHVKFRFMISKG